MANLTQTAEQLVMDAMLGTTAWAPTAPLKLKLMTVAGTATTAGTEVTGGSYVAGGQTITFAATNTSGQTSNSNTLTYSGMPAVTVVGFEIWDTNATSKRLWFIPATQNKTTNAGDVYSVAIGAIVLNLS